MRSSNGIPDVRANATPSPATPPPTKPIADSATVHFRPTRRKRNSLRPMPPSSLDRVAEIAGGYDPEDAHQQPGHDEVEHRHRAVDLEAPETAGLDTLRHGGQF